MVNRIWPAYVAGWSWQRADTVCFACHGSGPNSINHGEILLEYGIVLHIFKLSFYVVELFINAKSLFGEKYYGQSRCLRPRFYGWLLKSHYGNEYV